MFRARTRLFTLLAISTVTAGLMTGGHPAVAAAPPASFSVLPAAAGPSDPTDRYRTQVRRLADLDPREEVVSAAWTVLLNEDDPDGPRKFLLPGGDYSKARQRASTNASRNDLIIRQTILTSHPLVNPYTNMTAKRASFGTLKEKDRYVRTGLQEAKDLDARHSPVEAAKQQAKEDRLYVADLAVNASGPWVKAAAARAVKLGTDADIAEFFKYAWGSAADCDLQAHRMKLIEQQLEYRSQLDNLIDLAAIAQKAYEGAKDAAKVKAAADAKLAWNTAASTAAATQEAWLANAQLAAEQARMWAAVHDFAVLATTKQDWPGIADKATATSSSWDVELAWAQQQEQEWSAWVKAARDSAAAIPDLTSGPEPTPTTPQPTPTATTPATPTPEPSAPGAS